MGLVSQLANLGLTVTGMSGDVYRDAVGPTAVTAQIFFRLEFWLEIQTDKVLFLVG